MANATRQFPCHLRDCREIRPHDKNLVIPAKAGTHLVRYRLDAMSEMGPRLRGDDEDFWIGERFGAGTLVAFLFLLLLFLTPPALAQPSFPPLTGRVVDAANVLPPEREAGLTQKLAALEAQ